MKAERCEEGEEVEVKESRKWHGTCAADRIRKDKTLHHEDFKGGEELQEMFGHYFLKIMSKLW